jgi:hypothetical protein
MGVLLCQYTEAVRAAERRLAGIRPLYGQTPLRLRETGLALASS